MTEKSSGNLVRLHFCTDRRGMGVQVVWRWLEANARAFAQQHYDLKTVCLPKQLEWVEGLSQRAP